MNQPTPPDRQSPPTNPQSDQVLTVSYVVDAATVKQLSRAAVLARWRSPAGLGTMALIP